MNFRLILLGMSLFLCVESSFAIDSFYERLGLKPNATPDQIKKAHRRLARVYHPDLNPGDKEAEEKFKQIQEAFDVLSDKTKRSLADLFSEGQSTEPFEEASMPRDRDGRFFRPMPKHQVRVPTNINLMGRYRDSFGGHWSWQIMEFESGLILLVKDGGTAYVNNLKLFQELYWSGSFRDTQRNWSAIEVQIDKQIIDTPEGKVAAYSFRRTFWDQKSEYRHDYKYTDYSLSLSFRNLTLNAVETNEELGHQPFVVKTTLDIEITTNQRHARALLGSETTRICATLMSDRTKTSAPE